MNRILFPLLFAICAGMLLLMEQPASAGTIKPDACPGSFTDRSGNRILVEKPYERIISLYAAHTENLFFLGLDKEIIGVSREDMDLAPGKPVFSARDDAEKFIAAGPDLVLIRPMIARGYAGLVKRLQDAGITVVSLQPRTVGEIYLYWRRLGLLAGREEQAEAMIKAFEAGLEQIRSIVSEIPEAERKRVYFEAMHGKMRTFSPASIAVFALETAGGINIAGDAASRHNTNIAAYGKERIMSHADEIDVFLAQQGRMNRVTIQTIIQEPGFEAIKAVREGNVCIVNEEIVSRPSLRLLEGILCIGKCLYPERFAQTACISLDFFLPGNRFSRKKHSVGE